MDGYVDLHCHGGGGVDFASCAAEDVAVATGIHQQHGTSAMLASLVSASSDLLRSRLALFADLIAAGNTPIVGTHLEGPFLSSQHSGAHDPTALRAPSVVDFVELHAAARGTLRMITLAPELPGALEVIDAAVERGVLVAVGHTDATYAQAKAAFDRGASVATHLFNAMRPLHHREPGPVQAALDSPHVWCELIVDGVHLHPAVVAAVFRACPERVVLVTDAMSAAGAADGDYQLGTMQVAVRSGVARLPDGTIAGSTLTMDRALERAVAAGVPVQAAHAAATTNPAAALGSVTNHPVTRLTPGAV